MEERADARPEVRWGSTLALVALAMTVALGTVLHIRAQARRADERAAAEQLRALCLALGLHRDAVGRYPSSEEGLHELWGLSPETLTDPWGARVGYSATSDRQSFVLRASGEIELASGDCEQPRARLP